MAGALCFWLCCTCDVLAAGDSCQTVCVLVAPFWAQITVYRFIRQNERVNRYIKKTPHYVVDKFELLSYNDTAEIVFLQYRIKTRPGESKEGLSPERSVIGCSKFFG